VRIVLLLAGLIALWAIGAAWVGPQRSRERAGQREQLLEKAAALEAGGAQAAEFEEKKRVLVAKLREVWGEPWEGSNP